MCEITPLRGFIILLLGEAKVNSDLEFFSKSLNVVCEKLCRILSQTTQHLFLSFVPQDITPYSPDDPIALNWEYVSDNEECRSYLCEQMRRGDGKGCKDFAPLSLSQMAGILHGFLDAGVDKLGPSVLLDVILPISESGVSQLCEGDEAMELYGALKRVGWQNGHVTAMFALSVNSHLLISPAVNTSVVVTEGEKLDCIEEGLWWRGVFHPTFDPFNTENQENRLTELSLSINLNEQRGDGKKKKSRKKKFLINDEELKSESPFMILTLNQIVSGEIPLHWIDSGHLNLYSSDKNGERALLNLRRQLTSLEEGDDDTESVAILNLLSCTLEQTLNTDTWYEYVIGKQTHWINHMTVQILCTPHYCLPPQGVPSNGIWRVWLFKQKVDIPQEVLDQYIIENNEKTEKKEEDVENNYSDLVLPEYSTKHFEVIHSTWSKFTALTPPSESGIGEEEYNKKVDEVLKPLDSLPTPPQVNISKYADTSANTPGYPEDEKDTFEYKVLCAMEKYNDMKKERKSSVLKSLGGFSPPPMTHSKDKVGVDSLFDCFDKEGLPVGDLETIPVPSNPKRKDIRTRLFANATQVDEDKDSIEYSWAKFQKNLVKNETKGLMNYESPPKYKPFSQTFLPQDTNSSRHNSLPEPISFLKNKLSEKDTVKVSPRKKLTPKNKIKTRVRSKSNIRASKGTKPRPKSESESTGDNELRSLLERSVVKALKGEGLTREHPQFKSAYTQLFNVSKCFLAGLEVEVAKEKVEHIAISNAKQVVELQVNK